MSVRVLQGDAITMLRGLPSESVHCCVTSPPYWGLRDYGVKGQLGLEETPEKHVEGLVIVLREVRRVLRSDGTLWLNYGDCYDSGTRATRDYSKTTKHGYWNNPNIKNRVSAGLKPKDLIGMPWMVAFALRADGWWLRSDIIWAKPNPMPESVTDRPTRAHEYLFLLSKSERYHYDHEAIKEPSVKGAAGSRFDTGKTAIHQLGRASRHPRVDAQGRNKRSVWTVPTRGYPGAHFATFPPELIRPCIKAGCPPGGTVLDPFAGAGTTGLVADQEGRNALLIELKPEYCSMIRDRLGFLPVAQTETQPVAQFEAHPGYQAEPGFAANVALT